MVRNTRDSDLEAGWKARGIKSLRGCPRLEIQRVFGTGQNPTIAGFMFAAIDDTTVVERSGETVGGTVPSSLSDHFGNVPHRGQGTAAKSQCALDRTVGKTVAQTVGG